MANLRSAAKNLKFDMKLNEVDDELKTFLTCNDLDKVLVLGGFFEHLPLTPEAHDEAQALAKHAGAGARLPEWTDKIVELYEISCEVGSGVAAKVAAVGGFHLSSDLMEFANSAAEASEDRDLRVLAVQSLAALPSKWQGKTYRRASLCTTEHAREEAETE